MEDRKTSFVAAAVGCVAIGGFWMARPTGPRADLRVLEQRNLPVGGIGMDWDAATVFRLKTPAAVREAQEDKALVEYRIIDRQGRIYPLAPMVDPAFFGALKLQRGYADRPEGPRIQLLVQGRLVATTSIGDLPVPQEAKLDPKPHPCIALVYHGDWLEAVPRGIIPRNERWQVVVRRTSFAPSTEAFAIVPNRGSRWPSSRLRLPFADQAEAAEVEVTRYRFSKVSDVVDISGLRLEERFGGTALVVDETRFIDNSLGVEIRLPKQYSGPYRFVRHQDPRVGRASISVTSTRSNSYLEGRPGEPIADYGASGQILSPKPESLGLRELRIGPAIRRSETRQVGPIKTGPFTVRARFDFFRPLVVERFRATVPIEFGPRAEPVPNDSEFMEQGMRDGSLRLERLAIPIHR